MIRPQAESGDQDNMEPNQYIQVGTLINSCLLGANVYHVRSTAEDFSADLLEEISDPIRQLSGHSYMRACAGTKGDELWMVPFAITPWKLTRLQQAMEQIHRDCLGKEHFYFPFDVVEEDGMTAYLIHPIEQSRFRPIRTYMPDALAERWSIARSLFERVKELKRLGLTSNGISREQMRVCPRTNQVKLWLNETVSFIDGSQSPENILRHMGFFSIPEATENQCAQQGLYINGHQRDLFSAAVAAFYLILYTHPFVGSGFNGLLRDDYLTHYQCYPAYILSPGSGNDLGNQLFGRVVEAQWNRTVKPLRELFDSMFLAIQDPKTHWKNASACWDVDAWLAALDQDAQANDNEASHSDYHFVNERYHQV